MFGLIAITTFILLARAFRSLLLPAKAIVLNALRVAAACGVMVLVWHEGYGSEAIWDIQATGSIPSDRNSRVDRPRSRRAHGPLELVAATLAGPSLEGRAVQAAQGGGRRSGTLMVDPIPLEHEHPGSAAVAG